MARKILVVEDDPDIRESLQQSLELEGYEIVTAENGQEALDTLERSGYPSLILLDLMMPVMDGFEFMNRRKSDLRLRAIPLVVISAVGERARVVEADASIRKPVDLEVLLKAVHRYSLPGEENDHRVSLRT